MRLLNKSFAYTALCALALGLPGFIHAQAAQPANSLGSANQETFAYSAPAVGEVASAELPDSPGTSWAKAQDASSPQNNATPQDNSAPQSSSVQPAAPASTAPASTQTNSGQDQTPKPQRPVGTAAAEAPKVNGVTAAQPAGVAIAPAKQHRVRTLVLKVGAIVGAGAAVGTVIALTAATPSKPPGAH